MSIWLAYRREGWRPKKYIERGAREQLTKGSGKGGWRERLNRPIGSKKKNGRLSRKKKQSVKWGENLAASRM